MPPLLEARWEGPDGSSWDLLDLRSGVQLVALDGVGMPTFANQFSDRGPRDGRRYEGTKWNQAIHTLSVSVGDMLPMFGMKYRRRGDDWRALDAAWRNAVSPEETGRLTITTGAGGSRYIDLRLDQPFIFPSNRDPALIGEATYTMVMTADDQPWWVGERVDAEFAVGTTPQPFFVTTGQNLFYISEASRANDAFLTNPGDRPAYPVWYAKGPFLSVVIGTATETVSLPFSRAAGQKVFVDTLQQTIVDENGSSLWPLMGFATPNFGPLPARSTTPLVTTMTGSTSESAIGISLDPLYRGPW